MSAIFVALAFAVPFAPLWAGSPARGCFGFRAGDRECLGASLALMIVAAIGVAATQSVLPMSRRRWTFPKALVVGVVWVIVAGMPR